MYLLLQLLLRVLISLQFLLKCIPEHLWILKDSTISHVETLLLLLIEGVVIQDSLLVLLSLSYVYNLTAKGLMLGLVWVIERLVLVAIKKGVWGHWVNYSIGNVIITTEKCLVGTSLLLLKLLLLRVILFIVKYSHIFLQSSQLTLIGVTDLLLCR